MIGVFAFLGKGIPLLSTLTPSQELENCHMIMKFLTQHHLYVNNMCAKFQDQKDIHKENI